MNFLRGTNMKWLGVVAALVAVVGGMKLGGSLSDYLNVPSLLFVLLFGGGIVITAHGIDAVRIVFRSLLGMMRTDESEQARIVMQTAVQAFVAAGWVGGIIGVVQLLQSLNNLTDLGPGAAVALLTPLYGYIFAYLGCLPLARSLASRDTP